MGRDLGHEIRAEILKAGSRAWKAVGAKDWEERAAEVLDRDAFDYIAGGAGAEWTVRANREAFDAWRLLPRMLTGDIERELSVEVFGTRSSGPFLLAPIGVQSIAHRDGELATARAGAATGIPLVVSTASSSPMEEVAQAMGQAPRWYQLYWVNDRDIVASLVSRAEAAGFAAIVVTLDTLILGWRERDLRNRYLPFTHGHGIAQFTSDPVFRSRLVKTVEEDPLGAIEAMFGMFHNLALTWADIAWLRARTKLPLVAKGILRADDARRALEAGFDGVIVSNHGGRQVDGAIAALDALPEVRRALGPDVPLLMDSGVRTGPDVLKALALGANAVLIGRPYMYGLAVAGQEGVEQVIRSLLADIDLTLTLVGCHSVRAIDTTYLRRQP